MTKGKRKEGYLSAQGDLITPEIEEALADEAERGYDLSKARRRYIGRPPLGDGGTSPRITFRFPQSEFNAVRKRAEEENRSLSDLARVALREYMKS